MTKNESVWAVRDPSGAIVGAGAERRIDQHGILCGDGPFAALDNAFGRYSTQDAYRALTRDVEHESANRYEAFGYTLALESLATPPETDAGPNGETFTAWLCEQMPAGTVIGNPAWWAPQILRAVRAFTETATDAGRVRLLDEWRVIDKHERHASWHPFVMRTPGDHAIALQWCDKEDPVNAPHRVVRVALVDDTAPTAEARGGEAERRVIDAAKAFTRAYDNKAINAQGFVNAYHGVIAAVRALDAGGVG